MRVVLQRVTRASVTIEGKVEGAVGQGLLILSGIEDADGPEDILWLSRKIVNLQ